MPPYSFQPSRLSQQTNNHNKKRPMRLSILLVIAITLFCFLWNNLSEHSTIFAKKPEQESFAKILNNRLLKAWQTDLISHQGDVAIAVYNKKTGQTTQYSTTNSTFNTASIIKLSILEEMLMQDQASNTGISADQLALATPMIENSDDNSASTLWSEIGGSSAMNSFFKQVGAASTTTSSDDLWGLTQTTAADQLKIINAVAYPGKFLTTASAQQADTLLDNVESDQAWGVSAGSPNNVEVELKNGWLPDSETGDAYSSNQNDWTMNSIGHVHGDGQDYTIAILTMGNPGQGPGIALIQSLATATWQTLSSN